MNKTAFFLAAFLLIFNFAFAQQDPLDRGLQDSVIIDSVSIPLGQTFAFVPIYAMTDDSVAYYNLPFTWAPYDVGVDAIVGVQYYWPINTWDMPYDTLMSAEHYIRHFAIYDVCYPGPRGDPLFTSYQKLHVWSLIFEIPPDIEPLVIRIDTCYDSRAGSTIFGDISSITEFVPAIKSGAIVIGNPTKIDQADMPFSFSLDQNYPNPFNPTTTIEFSLLHQSHVLIEIFDILGQRVRILVDWPYCAGNQSVEWDGTNDNGIDVNSGIYFYKLTSCDFVQAKKMVLMR